MSVRIPLSRSRPAPPAPVSSLALTPSPPHPHNTKTSPEPRRPDLKWIAPSEKDTSLASFEKNLWDAADHFRANSGLKAQEYSSPILGLIFLRFAEVRFLIQRAKLQKAETGGRRGSRLDIPAAYHADSILYLSPNARFDHLLQLPEAEDIGEKVNEAMRQVEQHNPHIAGILPKSYNIFTSSLLKEILKKISEIPASLDFDAFGRIYEYFLGAFAMSEGQGGGEFYTPASIVQLLVQIIEPYHGKILAPACGSGGMFVQSARFVAQHRKNLQTKLSIYGVEKTDETGRLCRLNLAVHGLEGDIRHGGNINSYYDDPFNAAGRFDFVLANPPFNVNAVDKESLKDAVGPGRRFPFGLPNADNANYLWIQLFLSSLNPTGRAGFVMAGSASDARSSEQDIRKKLIQSKAVDVMVSVGPNMFNTVALGCTLWFLDRGKKNTPRENQVLFIDARNIYRQIDRAHRDWTPAQIGFISNIVRLYRGEKPDLTLGGKETEQKLHEIFGKNPVYTDIPGLCKVATLDGIKAQDYSLNPGRYIGIAPTEEISDYDFQEQLQALNQELEELNSRAQKFEKIIAKNIKGILGV